MSEPEETRPIQSKKPLFRRILRYALIFLGVFLLVVVIGGSAGYFSGRALHTSLQQDLVHKQDLEQYNLALEDITAGRYKSALSRLAHVLENEPGFPGALEKQQEALAAIKATATPVPTATLAPSPTPDVSKAEQLFNKAKQQFTDKDYPGMIGTLLSLKVQIPDYQPSRVDGLLWVALRYNGVHLIKDTNRLTEGLYYLDLAANYAPLDSEAAGEASAAITFLNVYEQAYYNRNKDIEVSLTYFVQAVSIRPYYTDNLIKDYGDMMIANGQAAGSPCGEVEVFNPPDLGGKFYLPVLESYEPFTTERAKAQHDCDLSRPTAEPATPVPTPT